jgi:hypothetical protein
MIYNHYQNILTMAHSKTNLITLGFSGKLGNQVIFRNVNGQSIMQNFPSRRHKKAVGKQVETCQRFREASRYAKTVLKNPEMLAAYRAKAKKGQTAYNVAVADYLTSPVVTDIDASMYHGHAGEKITVTAKDSFRVMEVTVILTGPEGVILEKGACIPGISEVHWHYTAQTEIGNTDGLKISAVARDHTRHTAELSVVI